MHFYLCTCKSERRGIVYGNIETTVFMIVVYASNDGEAYKLAADYTTKYFPNSKYSCDSATQLHETKKPDVVFSSGPYTA